MKTLIPKVMATADRKWYLIDAAGLVLGNVATKAANILRGKKKATFTPHLDGGDYVIIINAEKAVLTGKKMENKIYYKHTRYPGHLAELTAKHVVEKKPDLMLKSAIKGMLPHNRLEKEFLRRLKIVVGTEHQFAAQQPQVVQV